MELAPIVLFVYNRPWHTEQTLNALMKNELADESVLYIYADGPKTEATQEELKQISEVRQLIKKQTWCKNLIIKESSTNKGIYNSIVTGVTTTLIKHKKIIVLEDDIITSNKFLYFMNRGLNLYENDDKVMSVTGYSFPVKSKLPDTFFLVGISSWGWGTWERAWKYFNSNPNLLIEKLKKDTKLINKFNFNNSYDYFQMLEQEVSRDKKNRNWDILWYASVFFKNGLGLYPGKSLVNNIGFDNSGIHCGNSDKFFNKTLNSKIKVSKIDVKENTKSLKKISFFLRESKFIVLKNKTVNFFKKKL